MDERRGLKIQLISAWCGPAFLVTFVFFWGVLAHNIPNPAPSLSPAELAARYTENLGDIRLGFIVSLIAVVLYMPWTCVLAARMSRIEGPVPVLAFLQLIGGALTVMVVSFSAMFWAVAAFRPERNPELIQLLTDTGWLAIDLQYACTTLQMWALAVCVLLDRKSKHPLFPQWHCYFTIFAGASFFPASLTGVLTTGPFAWNGVMSYYFPYACWLGWEIITSGFLIKNIRREIADSKASASSEQEPVVPDGRASSMS